MKELGIYIHIPFCKKKCDYCDFISYCNKEDLIEEYIEKLKEEIESELNNKEYNITTIYIGGGTPSFIDSKYIADILNILKEKYDLENTEITIEVNPGTVIEQKLLDYKKTGINRLSIGLQETSNELLKQIGRIHTYEEFLETYNLARNVGFKNINVDLMIGLPNQSIQNIKESLNKVITLNPEHISVYSLILEEGTKLYQKYENKEIKLPDDELERNMYWYVKNILENNGYKHYEISNFSKKGYNSKHNMNCWEQK
jgi:oxygen-independent coproporphyrinogen-3 oxidase